MAFYKDREPNIVLIELENGNSITREMIEERLIAYESTRAFESAIEGDFDSISYMVGDGCRGFYEMDDDELLENWDDSEDGFYLCWSEDRLVFDILDSDPLHKTNFEDSVDG